MEVVRNSHRALAVCKFARANLINCQEISNLLRLADPRNDENRIPTCNFAKFSRTHFLWNFYLFDFKGSVV